MPVGMYGIKQEINEKHFGLELLLNVALLKLLLLTLEVPPEKIFQQLGIGYSCQLHYMYLKQPS